MQERVKKVISAMPKDFEAAVIGTPNNRFYLLDFDAHSAGTLVVLPHKMVYIIDSRYIEEAQNKVKNAEVVLQKDAMTQMKELFRTEGVKNVYLEHDISVAQYEEMKKDIPSVNFIITDELSKQLALLREVKDEEELDRMSKAQEIVDACFSHVLGYIKEGVREIDLMLEMELFMRKNGAQGVAFDTICLAGANGSLPHGVPSENKIKPGDFITMDFGAKYKGYCSDMTRTVALGQPSEEQLRVYDVVLKAHLAGIAAAKTNVLGKDVDKVARDVITEAGYADYFGHGLGHSVGIAIHEEPRYSPLNNTNVRAGTVMTVEPGIYLPGKFGVRIEDMVVVGDAGGASITKSPKELMML